MPMYSPQIHLINEMLGKSIALVESVLARAP